MKALHKRVAIGLGSIALAVIAASPAPVQAAEQAGPYTGVSISGDANWSSVSNPNAPITPTTYAGGGDTVYFVGSRTDGNDLNWGISPGSGVTLTEGTTLPMTNSQETGGIHITHRTWYGSECAAQSGTATILEVQRDESGNIAGLALDWSGTCGQEGGPTTLGQIRWNSSLGYAGLDAPAAQPYDTTYVGDIGAGHNYVWTARGTAPVTVPKAKIRADGTPWFIIKADSCAGKTLQPGETCSVWLGGAPRGPSYGSGSLGLNNADGERSFGAVPLEVGGKYGAKGTMRPLSPRRLLDTRSGLGAPKARVAPGKSITVTVLGKGGVPGGSVSAVVLNLTAAGTTASTHVTAYPAGGARPTASSLNAPPGATVANTITVKPGAGGAITLYNNAGYTHLLVDVVGFYYATQGAATPAGNYTIVKPERIVDTRTAGGRLQPGYYIEIPLPYPDSVGQIQSYALNVTVTGATGAGYVTAWSGNEVDDPTKFSTVNYTKGASRANTTLVRAVYGLAGTGSNIPGFAVFNGSGSASVHVIVDVVGVYVDQGTTGVTRFKPTAGPIRIVDSRKGLGTTSWGTGSTRTVSAPASVAGYDTWALVGNAALIAPTSPSYMTFFSSDATRPSVSSINAGTKQIVANGVTAELGIGNKFKVYNNAGTAHAVYDVSGSFELFPPTYATLSGTAPTGQATLTSSRDQDLPSSLRGAVEQSPVAEALTP